LSPIGYRITILNSQNSQLLSIVFKYYTIGPNTVNTVDTAVVLSRQNAHL